LQLSALGKLLRELCDPNTDRADNNFLWDWPVFAEGEIGLVMKEVTTPDMVLSIYSTAEDEKVSAVVKKMNLDGEKVLELTLFFNSSINNLTLNSICEKNTLLVVDMKRNEEKQVEKVAKRRKTTSK
jgi:hypothetical protein